MLEPVSKKEFCEKYASKKDKDNLKGAAMLAYLCAAISLGFGIVMHNYAVVVDIILIVGLALGVQITKSRACAVLLLVYSCFNTVVMTIDTGRVSGWWLIFVGIWAVRGTFRLHKDYRNFLQDGTIPQNIEPKVPAKDHVTAGKTMATLLPFIGMFLGMLLIWLSISPTFLEMLVGGAQSPEALLQGYEHWYIAIMGAAAIAVLLTALGGVVSVRKGFRTRMSVLLMVVCLAFPILFGGVMVASENVPALLSQSKEDLAQIESGQLQEVTVWLSPKSSGARLPGPYAKGQPEPVTRYGGIGDDTEGVWVEFYVPNSLGFSLDQNALYHESESISWNEENAQQYRLYFTEHFHLVVSAEPVG